MNERKYVMVIVWKALESRFYKVEVLKKRTLEEEREILRKNSDYKIEDGSKETE